MKITALKVGSRVQATIKMSWLKSIDIDISSIDLLKANNHPNDWDKIEATVWNKQTMREMYELVAELNETDEEQTCSMLLSIAGKHPNELQNIRFLTFLTDKEAALLAFNSRVS